MQSQKGRRAALLLVLALLIFFAALFLINRKEDAPKQGNLITNGDFSAVTDGMPDGWTPGMWVTSIGASYLEAATLDDGTTVALIENAAANDARFEQTVSVEGNTTYRLTARVRAQGVDTSKIAGANVSFLGIYGTSESAYDTAGDFTTLTLYARTGKDQKEATVCVRVGGYGSEATGKAWFTDVQLVKVDSVPTGALVLDIAPGEAQSETPSSAAQPAIPMLLLTALSYLLIAWIIARGFLGARDSLARAGQERVNWRAALMLLLVAAAALRIVLAFAVEGYGVDMNCFTAWATRMAETGPANFYSEENWCDYPPVYMLFLGVIGSIARLIGLPLTSAGGQALLKLAPIACDIVLAYVMFNATSRETGRRPALGIAALIAFNPALIITGSCWGQIDTLLALMLVFVLLSAREGRWTRAIVLFALAVLTKPQAGLLAPLGIAALIKEFIDPQTRRQSLKPVLLGLGAGVLLTAAVLIPFSIHQTSPLWIVDKYVSTLTSYDYATLSTGNLMFLLGGNWVKTSESLLGPLTYGQLGAVLMVLSFAMGIAVYMPGKGRGRLMLASAVTLQSVFCLGSMMHERYVIPALVLLVMAYLESGDVRLLISSVIASAASAVNIGVVLAYDYLIAPNLWLGRLIAVAQLVSLALTLFTAFQLTRGKAPIHLSFHDAKSSAAQTDASETRMREELLQEKDYRLHMTRRDIAIMLGITAVYAVIAFIGLGSTKAPQSGYASTAEGETVVFDLGEMRTDFHIYYYGAISDTQFSFAASDDGVNYGEEHDAYFARGECFKWMALRAPLYDANGVVSGATGGMTNVSGRYVRLTFKGAGASLWEIGFVDGEGNALPVSGAKAFGGYEGRQNDPALLIDEQDTVPIKPSYYNSMYFDEVYHARTGYEHANALYTYETTHPPLGKVFMSICIRILGMTPFAWRLAGTLAGILMLPALYLLAKQLFGRTRWAALCTLLMAADCMHYTQTRIATIDSFPVLFIILMFFFMLRYTRMSFYHQPLIRTFVPLALSGVFMGLAIASKWIGCYSAVGLALLFFARMFSLWRQSRYAREHSEENEAFARAAKAFPTKAVATLASCVVFFVLVPLIIYVLSYIPYLRAYGPVRFNAATFERIWQAQVTMFRYHSNLNATHAFASPWYEWPVIARPMWYYNQDFKAPGMASSILSFGNPAVWWTGLVGILFVLCYSFYRNALPALGVLPARDDPYDRAMPLIAVGFLSAYLPWVLVPRLTFIYHYFASVPFIILATAQALRYLERARPKAAHIACGVLAAAAVLLFIGFFPLASGFEVPRAWCDAMNWFPNWMYY